MFQNKTAITLFVMLLIAALVAHFALTTVYSFRDSMPYTAYSVADKYSVPCFHQNWKLFAPDVPKYTVQLEYRTVVEETNPISVNDTTVTKTSNTQDSTVAAPPTKWSEWKDATASAGQSNRKMETVEQGFCTQLGNQLLNNLYSKQGEVQLDRVVASPAYASALYYVMKWNKQDAMPFNIWQVRLRYSFTPAQGVQSEPKEELVEFPSYTHQSR